VEKRLGSFWVVGKRKRKKCEKRRGVGCGEKRRGTKVEWKKFLGGA